MLTRAAMAKCLSILPITFKSSDEAENILKTVWNAVVTKWKRRLYPYSTFYYGTGMIRREKWFPARDSNM